MPNPSEPGPIPTTLMGQLRRRAPAYVAGMLVLAAFVIGIDFIVTLVERRPLIWRPVAAETRT